MTNHVWLVHYKCFDTNTIPAELSRPASSEGNLTVISTKKGVALYNEVVAKLANECPKLPYRIIYSMTNLGEEEE
ncbi:MAG: hypothetical protein IK038_03290 [Bacteroidaceae bacterium]|nr:hypothetical protein [Bacteroidaceae bacterium]